ncbi:hypothetical protein [Streptomyces platensis]|uniref:hypothetical protein n=1 Tax=Streptomyces platensis TaxID=58346 RepID=UPI001F16C80B|nr:hypothetical protein [Streptomyces platensis]MCF3142464.1 hypothetical protein [Streptomyces platensis]
MDHDLYPDPVQAELRYQPCRLTEHRISRLEAENEELRHANGILIRIIGSYADPGPADAPA